MLAALGIVSASQRLAAMAVFWSIVAIGAFTWLKVHDLEIRHDAIVERDAIWTKKLSDASALAERQRKSLQDKVDAAAERERAATESTMIATERAAQLERDIAALKTDPVVWPRAIARDLRK